MSGKSPKRSSSKKTKPAKKAAKTFARTPSKRSQPESFRGRSLGASLTVKDLAASVAWYRDVLGFHVHESYSQDGKLQAVELKAGAVQIWLNQDDGAAGLDRVKGAGMSFQVTTTQDVDTLGARITSNGGNLTMPPTTMSWGPRVLRVQDPDGFRWVISSDK
jgi:uncharacterized glyoxalase superfamily protein PhnB